MNLTRKFTIITSILTNITNILLNYSLFSQFKETKPDIPSDNNSPNEGVGVINNTLYGETSSAHGGTEYLINSVGGTENNHSPSNNEVDEDDSSSSSSNKRFGLNMSQKPVS